MASVTPLRSSTFGRVLIVLSASALFACTVGNGTGDPPEVVLLVDRPTAAPTPPPTLADFERDMLAFAELCPAPSRRFPLELTVLPFDPSARLAAGGPGRCAVTPGRASSVRQTVPARSRRKVRVWERDAAA